MLEPDHERDALRRRARHPRRVLRRRLDARRAGLLRARLQVRGRGGREGGRRRRHARDRLAGGGRRARRQDGRVGRAGRAGALPRPQRLRARDRVRGRRGARRRDAGSTGRSTAWASAPATRTSARSRSRCARSTASSRTCASTASATSPRACRSCRATRSSRGSRSPARRSSGASRARSRRSSTIRRRSSRTRRELVAAERGIVLGKKSGLDSIRIKAEELGLDVPEERRAELLAQVKELGTRKRGLVTDDEFRELVRWLSTTRSSSAAASTRSRAARCSRARGWRVCVLERNDWLGGAIQTAEITEPGFHHDVFSAWHPLWVGGAAHAQLGDELAARGLEYLNTELPTATAFPDGEARSCCARPRRTRRSSGRSGRACSSGSSRTPTSRSACSAPSSGRGRARARREGVPPARPRRARRVHRRAAAVEPRLARDDVRVGARARPARAVGAAHRARARRGGVRAS